MGQFLVCYNSLQFLDWVEENHSFNTNSLIFGKPKDLIDEVRREKLISLAN